MNQSLKTSSNPPFPLVLLTFRVMGHRNPKVALTIDGHTFPYKVLQIRGTAHVEIVEGIVPEYALAAARSFDMEQSKSWVKQVRGRFPQMARIVIQPEWVGTLDFEQRFPSAMETAMSGQ